MQTVSGFEGIVGRGAPVVLAVGFFDGIHLGHRRLLETAIAEASALGGEAWAMTFKTHPLRILNPAQAPPLLTATAHQLILMERLGIDMALVLPFTRQMADQSAEDFSAMLLAAAPPLRTVVAGYDWQFGAGGRGSCALLASLAAVRGVRVLQVPSVCIDGAPVSSTRIRTAILYGRLDEVRRLLGRPFGILGRVEHGRGLGHRLGYPTANLNPHNEALPPYGIYAVRAYWRSRAYDGVCSYGVRPSVTPRARRAVLELHLFDFNDDVYGEDIEMDFVARIREERRFPSLESLREAIGNDCIEARRILKSTASERDCV